MRKYYLRYINLKENDNIQHINVFRTRTLRELFIEEQENNILILAKYND